MSDNNNKRFTMAGDFDFTGLPDSFRAYVDSILRFASESVAYITHAQEDHNVGLVAAKTYMTLLVAVPVSLPVPPEVRAALRDMWIEAWDHQSRIQEKVEEAVRGGADLNETLRDVVDEEMADIRSGASAKDRRH